LQRASNAEDTQSFLRPADAPAHGLSVAQRAFIATVTWNADNLQ
jgi:hypothetical protein